MFVPSVLIEQNTRPINLFYISEEEKETISDEETKVPVHGKLILCVNISLFKPTVTHTL